MDRPIVYDGALTQALDVLNAAKNTLYGLGYALQAALGTTTSVIGLVGAQTTVPSLQITIGSGAIHAPATVDATAYGDLGTDTNTIMKQGILKAPVALTLTAPTTSGYSQVYLVEASYLDVDGGTMVLGYYNSAAPLVPFAGPNGLGASNLTTRQGQCVITLKPGVAAPSGSQTTPATDPGNVPLYTITLANGQTTITTAQIIPASGAPFVPYNLNNLLTYFLPLAGGTMTGPLKAPAGFSAGLVIITASTALTLAQSGSSFVFGGASTYTVTVPTGVNGSRYAGYVTNATGVTLSTANNFVVNSTISTTLFLPYGTYFDICSDATNWCGFVCGPGIYAKFGTGTNAPIVYSVAGSYTFTAPITGWYWVENYGAGGGAGLYGSGSTAEGEGGGGGGFSGKWIYLTAGTVVPYVIGAQGASSGAGTGTAGGTTSFGAYHSATGGGPGNVAGTIGAGGTGVGGDINLTGQAGFNGDRNFNALQSGGGDAAGPYGGKGAVGGNATWPGGGGLAAATTTGTPSTLAAADGGIIIRY